jgi:hypothetical protein
MSIRKKILATVSALFGFAAWKLVDFYEYVAIFCAPQELSARAKKTYQLRFSSRRDHSSCSHRSSTGNVHPGTAGSASAISSR